MVKMIIMLGFILLAFGVTKAFALADPDVITIERVNRYDSIDVSGDVLFLVEYRLEYTVTPSETVTEGYLGRLIDVGGSGQLGSVAPVSDNIIPDSGYSRGVYSFYFATAPTVTGTLTVTLEGNPSLTPTPVGITTTSITTRSPDDLDSDVRLIAVRQESDWSTDLITFISGDLARFTDDGENYWAAAVPNLRDYAPSLFSISFVPFEADDGPVRDTTSETTADALIADSPIDHFFVEMAAATNMPKLVIETFAILGIAMAIAFPIWKMTGDTAPPLMSALLIIVVGAGVGIGPLNLVYTLAFVSVFVLGYIIFWQRASA